MRLHWRLPLLSTPVTSIAFHPQSTASLVVTETNNSFLVYEADGMCLSEWSKSNNSEKIMTALKSVNGPVCGVTFDPSSDCSMLLYGQGFIVYIDLTQSIPKHPKIVLSAPDKPNPFRLFSGIHKVPGRGNGRENKSHGNGKGFGHGMRRKSNGGEDSDSNFAIIQRYRSMVHVGCVADSQLVCTLFTFYFLIFVNCTPTYILLFSAYFYYSFCVFVFVYCYFLSINDFS